MEELPEITTCCMCLEERKFEWYLRCEGEMCGECYPTMEGACRLCRDPFHLISFEQLKAEYTTFFESETASEKITSLVSQARENLKTQEKILTRAVIRHIELQDQVDQYGENVIDREKCEEEFKILRSLIKGQESIIERHRMIAEQSERALANPIARTTLEQMFGDEIRGPQPVLFDYTTVVEKTPTTGIWRFEVTDIREYTFHPNEIVFLVGCVGNQLPFYSDDTTAKFGGKYHNRSWVPPIKEVGRFEVPIYTRGCRTKGMLDITIRAPTIRISRTEITNPRPLYCEHFQRTETYHPNGTTLSWPCDGFRFLLPDRYSYVESLDISQVWVLSPPTPDSKIRVEVYSRVDLNGKSVLDVTSRHTITTNFALDPEKREPVIQSMMGYRGYLVLWSSNVIQVVDGFDCTLSIINIPFVPLDRVLNQGVLVFRGQEKCLYLDIQ